MLTTINKAFIILLISILAFHTEAGAQRRWKDGYIVTTRGDTLFGKIAYMEKSKAPVTVTFKKEKGTAKQQFSSSEIRSFKVHLPFQDLYFKSFTADIDISQSSLQTMNNSKEPNLQSYTFFAQLLVKGAKSLYFYKDVVVSKKHFLIEAPDGKLTDLINKHYFLDDSKTIAATNEAYKQQLIAFYANCAAVTFKKINDALYNSTDLISVAKDYNKCNKPDSASAYEYKREKIKAVFGFVFGPAQATFRDFDYGYSGFTFPKKYSVDAGMFLNLIMPNSEKRWAIYNELLFSQYDMSATGSTPYSGTTNIGLATVYMKMVNTVRYQYPWHKVKPFIQFGISTGYAISSTATTDDKNYPVTAPRFELSRLAGLGITYKKFEVEFRNERENGYYQYPAPSSTSGKYLLLFKCAFH